MKPLKRLVKITSAFSKKRAPNIILVLLVPLTFLIIGTLTLRDYGTNWDEPFHFNRGQAYLRYFLTGKTDFLDLPAYPRPKGSSDFVSKTGEQKIYKEAVKSKEIPGPSVRRSYFQSDIFNFEYFIENEKGHPPVSDIFAALANYIFYQKLGIMSDLDSHHLFEVLASFMIVLGVSLFVYYHFGKLPAIVSSLSLASYPLFFSESHFNIKDPSLAAFFGLSIIGFYFGVTKNRWWLVFFSAISTALALGTKFNAVFLPLIVIPWLIFFLADFYSKRKKQKNLFSNKNIKNVLPLITSILLYPAIVLAVFYALWPYLWSNPIENLGTIVGFYRQIGLDAPPELGQFLVKRWNTYPVIWIFYTTPIPILVLFVAGLFTSLFHLIVKKKHVFLLVLLWLFIPVARVSWPGTSIYGGVRQIMEFVPAMATLAGIGFWGLIEASNSKLLSKKFKKAPKFVTSLVILSLFFVLYEMIRIHPNQNVYFNQLIGGLSGARARQMPYWGNTYGNIYQQGVEWLNENIEINARLGLPIANMINVPRTRLRSDIDFSNAYWSGPAREGEYEMEMDFDWPPKYWYSFQYYDVYLNPVHVVSVDGVPLLKIWKNDLEHTKEDFKTETKYPLREVSVSDGRLNVDIGREVYLTRIVVEHSALNCQEQKGGFIAISSNSEVWEREVEPIDYPQVPPAAVGLDEDTFVFLFAGKKARYLTLETLIDNSCILNNPFIEVRGLAIPPID